MAPHSDVISTSICNGHVRAPPHLFARVDRLAPATSGYQLLLSASLPKRRGFSTNPQLKISKAHEIEQEMGAHAYYDIAFQSGDRHRLLCFLPIQLFAAAAKLHLA
jgi:hypothetical protein